MEKTTFGGLAAALLSLAAAAQVPPGTPYFIDERGPVSVRPGVPYELPKVGLTDTPYSSAGDPILAEAIGDCGTFGGATKAEVKLAQDPFRRDKFLVATLPAYTATKPGTCAIVVRWYSSGTEVLQLQVFDPQTVRAVRDEYYPGVAVKPGATSDDLRLNVLDGADRMAAGYRVRFDAPAACLEFPSGREAISDKHGAVFAPRVRSIGPLGHCPVTATLVETSQKSADLDVLVYDESLATLSGVPASITSYLNDVFVINITLRDVNGNPLASVPAKMRFESSSGAAPTLITGNTPAGNGDAITGGTGVTGWGIFTNGNTGNFTLIISALGRETRIPVSQGLRFSAGPSPAPAAPTKSVTGMWWGGLPDNGWGVSIVQHGEKLFCVIYGYGFKETRWYVMPAGSWNASHTVYTTDVFVPEGAPFSNYNPASYRPGPSGTTTLTFHGNDQLTLDYKFPDGTVVAHKLLKRQEFGSGAAPLTANASDMWWGGQSLNGQGLAMIQQGGTLFTLWFTYDKGASNTWYMMPGGTWTGGDTYEGRVYRTRGDFWGWATYHAADLEVNDVGSYKLKFGADGTAATFDYTVEGVKGTMPLTRLAF